MCSDQVNTNAVTGEFAYCMQSALRSMMRAVAEPGKTSEG